MTPLPTRRFPVRRAALLVAALAVIVYINTLPNDLVIDDRFNVLDNGFLRQPGGLKKIWTTNVWAFFGRAGASNYYRPLMHTTFYAMWRVSGPNPAGYHAVNIALHAAVSVLVFLWLRRLQVSDVAAWVAALLFAVHPIHTEPAAWISALPDLYCALFFLLGFWLYLLGETSSGWRARVLDAGAALCALLALLAKEIGFVLPLMLVLYELAQRRRPVLDVLRRRGFAYAGMALAWAAYLALRWHALGGLTPVVSRATAPGPRLVAGWFTLLYEYCARIVVPLKLSAFHVVPLPSGFLNPRVLAGITAAVALIFLTVWLRRRQRPEWLAPFLFVVALAPSFLTALRADGFWMGERYLYLPSVAFCWLVAVVLVGYRAAGAFGSKLAFAAAATLLLAYSARTISRNREWRDELGFYLHELQSEGESRHLRPLLVEACVRRGLAPQALVHAQAMVTLEPKDPRARNALGFVYLLLGRPNEGLAEYERAAELARGRGQAGFAARALNNLAVAYSNMRRPDMAIPRYSEAVRLDPEFAEGHNNLAVALFETGRLEEAALHLRAALRVNPAFAQAHSNLGLVLAAQRELAGARAALSEALRLEPGNGETVARLGEVQLLAGEREAARESFRRALVLDPANARAQARLAALGAR